MTETAVSTETQTTELAEQENTQSLPAFPTKTQIAEYQTFLKNYDEFIESVLVKSVDFGEIPGVDKPSLFKPGAEKLEKLMFLSHEKICIEKIVTDEFISFTYQTRVYDKAGNLKATCEGNCNSKEKKYRSVTVFENQATPEQKETGKRVEKISKGGKKYSVYVVEKEDYYDLQNTIMKMAQKRSYVGAILEATNSSGRFTQDVEDMDLPKKPAYTPAPRNNYQTSTTPQYSAPAHEEEVTYHPVQEAEVVEDASVDLIRKQKIQRVEDCLSQLGKTSSWLMAKYNVSLETASEKMLDGLFEQFNKEVQKLSQKS